MSVLDPSCVRMCAGRGDGRRAKEAQSAGGQGQRRSALRGVAHHDSPPSRPCSAFRVCQGEVKHTSLSIQEQLTRRSDRQRIAFRFFRLVDRRGRKNGNLDRDLGRAFKCPLAMDLTPGYPPCLRLACLFRICPLCGPMVCCSRVCCSRARACTRWRQPGTEGEKPTRPSVPFALPRSSFFFLSFFFLSLSLSLLHGVEPPAFLPTFPLFLVPSSPCPVPAPPSMFFFFKMPCTCVHVHVCPCDVWFSC